MLGPVSVQDLAQDQGHVHHITGGDRWWDRVHELDQLLLHILAYKAAMHIVVS